MTRIYNRLKTAQVVPITGSSIKVYNREAAIRFSSPDMVKEGFWIWKPGKNSIYISEKILVDTMGTFPENMTIKEVVDTIVIPEDRYSFTEYIEKMIKGNSEISFEARVKNSKSETPSWVKILARINRYPNKRLKDISGIIEDITEAKISEERNAQLLKIKDALLEINHHMATIGDLDKLTSLILKRISEAMSHIDCASFLVLGDDNYFTISTSIGYDPESIKKFKLPYNELFFRKIKADMYTSPMIVNDVDRIKGDVTSVAKTQKGIVIKSLLNTPINIDGKLVGIISLDSSKNYIFNQDDLEIMQYVKEQIEIAISKYKLYEEIKFISRHDQLTGFINRNYFEELFEQNLKLAKRYKGTFSLAVLDLDGLKNINDNYGHMAGDLLITTFSKRLEKYFRDTDIFSRFGGDEFVGLFLAIKMNTLEKKFRDFSAALSKEPFDYNGSKLTCAFSYGLATYPKDGLSFTELFKIADNRMYKQKNNKRI